MEKSLSVNRLAWKLLGRLLAKPAIYGVKIEKATCGATIVDAGVRAKGGFAAGKLITEICMGGLARADILPKEYGGRTLPSIFVRTDHPIIATLGSQYAGWQISENGFFAIGSGPARALARKPKKIYEQIGYEDKCDKAVMILEAEKLPSKEIIERFAVDCNISPARLAIIVVPTTSIAGAIQVAGRVVETGVHKLRRLGFDVSSIRYAWGQAPISPVHPDISTAMSRMNDAILYGGTAYYAVEYENEEELKDIVQKAPSNASSSYGKPFIEIFKDANFDFYRIDPNLFAPAIIIMNNVKTGNTFKSGEINTEALAKSFGFI